MLNNYRYTQTEQDKLLKSMTIICDTREHDGKNDHILNYFDSKKIPWKKRKLDYGDYSFMIPADETLGIPRDLYFDKEIMIERKNSLEEISQCFTESRDRLKKEMSLAPEHKIMIIENGSYVDMVSGNYNTRYEQKSFWASYHSFWHEFNLPIIFMPNKNYTGMFIRGYFQYYLRDKIK